MYQYNGTDTHRYGRKPRPFDPDLCGTNQGIWQHRRDKQPNCAKCAAHYNRARRAQYHQKKGAEVGLVQGGRQTPFIPKTAQDPT